MGCWVGRVGRFSVIEYVSCSVHVFHEAFLYFGFSCNRRKGACSSRIFRVQVEEVQYGA
jgi:hypothetical protein